MRILMVRGQRSVMKNYVGNPLNGKSKLYAIFFSPVPSPPPARAEGIISGFRQRHLFPNRWKLIRIGSSSPLLHEGRKAIEPNQFIENFGILL